MRKRCSGTDPFKVSAIEAVTRYGQGFGKALDWLRMPYDTGGSKKARLMGNQCVQINKGSEFGSRKKYRLVLIDITWWSGHTNRKRSVTKSCHSQESRNGNRQ